MEERIARFIAALRASGLRVSLAETQDAWRAVEKLGVADRDTFRLSLRATLVKEAQDIPTFEEIFPLYFGLDRPPMMDMQQGLSSDEQQMLQDGTQQALEEAADSLAADLERLLDWILNGASPSQEEMEQLGQRAGMQFARTPGQAQQMARRIQRLLGWREFQELLEALWELLAAMGMDPDTIRELKDRAAQNMEALAKQLEQYAGQAIGDQMVERDQERREPISNLMERPFETLTQEETRRLRDEVRRLAARLRTRAALRQRRGDGGRLDAKSTIRANLRYGGVPMELRFRTRRLKPKLVAFVDVSTSMRPVTQFFLSLLYQLQDQVQRTRSFAFIDHLEDVSEDLLRLPAEEAMRAILERLPPGHYNTDFGHSLREFEEEHMDALDSRTTVIILGDARNNYNDPSLQILTDISRRCKRTIWLNPEYPAQWGTGDSDMLDYAPLCSAVYQVRNLAQLAEAIDRLLAA